jgi:hypothetical protein
MRGGWASTKEHQHQHQHQQQHSPPSARQRIDLAPTDERDTSDTHQEISQRKRP